ncbi:MAG: preprotein translocase subunit SecF [Candidatus Berkelbacteria bacterium Licking1014_85]|uniref:Protein-export membrane protein SecF n=1 Tax=Candidatus Berkelbacteria bacterium Licking1014_85 TaxID=2017148 RepID=A0A554LM94_9BACT|nr:MAG: preprotein translocase subunit SecF [Candidatus Berkelbacteria bacterium Licking1014_85]
MSILKFQKFFLIISLILTVFSLVVLGIYKLKPGIDFTGGSVIEVSTKAKTEDIEKIFKNNNLPIIVSTSSDNTQILKTKEIDENTKNKIITDINGVGETKILRFETIGPTISKSLTKKAIWSVIIASLGIIMYIAFAFRNLPSALSSWRFGITAVVALLHDILITTGVFALAGIFYGYEVDSLFITALLTVMGFSVHDTIVVFDRVRENVIKNPNNNFYINADHALVQTLARSLNTSLTIIITLTALFILGGSSIQHFVFTLLFGIIIGTYSSIFVATSLLVLWYKK